MTSADLLRNGPEEHFDPSLPLIVGGVVLAIGAGVIALKGAEGPKDTVDKQKNPKDSRRHGSR